MLSEERGLVLPGAPRAALRDGRGPGEADHVNPRRAPPCMAHTGAAALKRGARILYLTRDPRATTLSAWHFVRQKKRKLHTPSVEELVRSEWQEGLHLCTGWHQHAARLRSRPSQRRSSSCGCSRRLRCRGGSRQRGALPRFRLGRRRCVCFLIHLVHVVGHIGIGIDVDGESKGQCCVTFPCSNREHITRSDHHSIPGEAGCRGVETRQVNPVLAA